MELKVWVEGMVRVVCGLTLDTSCQDVVIALAQAIGQTGRYVLVLKLQGTDRLLLAEDCPLQLLGQLGQLAAGVRFILRRMGPILSGGRDRPIRDRLPLPPRHREPEPLRPKQPQKALTFSLGSSTVPRRTKANTAWSLSPASSPEPRVSPIPFQDALSPVETPSSLRSKEEAFRQVLKQQRRLQDLEIQLQVLKEETEVWGQDRSAAGPGLQELQELEDMEERLRQTKWELDYEEYWEEQLQAETDKETDMQRHLDLIHLSMDDQSQQLMELQARFVRLEEDLRLRAVTRSSQPGPPQADQALELLRQELQYRLQHGEQLEATLSDMEEELRQSEEMLQDRLEVMEELKKELRQCNLQQFIQQAGGSPPTDHTAPTRPRRLPVQRRHHGINTNPKRDEMKMILLLLSIVTVTCVL
ncbi:hypothetical protein LDENG_00208160 [Lucifuga dentata]|nr:hypothetical protein LDENG_00208160 [Lucifuga dentata]